MKSNLATVSLALLAAAFVLGCQDVAPVGPDGLVPQFAKWTCETRPHHPTCAPPPAGDDFTVTITGSVVSAATQDVSGPGLLAQGILVDLSGFQICNLGMQTGQLFMPQGDDHVHFSFQFMHTETGTGVESQHTLAMLGELSEGDLLPPDPGTSAVITEKAGEPWSITSKGKNHKNGCKGEGPAPAVDFTVTFFAT